jgi:hypothetical protein
MPTWTSMGFRLLVLAVVSLLPTAISWPVGSAVGQPLFPGSLACPAGVPTGEQVGHGLLGALTAPLPPPQTGEALNNAWSQAEPNIEKRIIQVNRLHIPNGCNSDVDQFCGFHGNGEPTCSFVYVDITLGADTPGKIPSLQGLGQLQFTSLDVYKEGVNPRNVAAHTTRGPGTSVITDGVLAPEAWSATDTAYAIVLPHNGANGAIVIDLATTVTVCGIASGCTAPTIQADNDDVYQLDYFDETTSTWRPFAPFPKTGGSGLHTRPLSGSNLGSSFTARYVRVYATSGGSTFAISELQLWDTRNSLVSLGKPAAGPLPYQIADGVLAPTGQSSTDANYSVVLTHKTGSTTALMIDLGRVVQICGNKYNCGHEPTIQADNDDTYMFDYSIDGKDWTTYGFMDANGAWHGTFPSVGGSGLHTRDMNCTARPDPSSACSATNEGPNFGARYVRVYARSGGDTFAVSELQLWDAAGNLVLPAVAPRPFGVPYSPQTYGPEPFFVNGEFAPEGTAWDDVHYATKLGDCTKNPKSTCPVTAQGTAAPKSAALQIDLTAVFPISGITIQADHNDTYQVDGSLDGVTWQPLWTVPTVSDGGLRTRRLTVPPPSQQPPCPDAPTCARYVRVYATAGDGSYSVSELQVFTPQANTAGTYATTIDNQGFVWSDGRANDGQNFVCSYDGPFTTALGVNSGTSVQPSVQPFSTLPIQFYVASVSLNAHCTDGNDYNIAAAHQRQCSMTLVPPSSYAPPFTDRFQAGYCAPTSAAPQGYGILSYVQFDDSDTSESNGAIQFASKDTVFGTKNGSDLVCSDWDSLDAHIPDVLRGVIPPIAAAATKLAVNAVLDYHNSTPWVAVDASIVPFPRVTGQTNPPPPLRCAEPVEAPAPGSAVDNVQGSASNVGSGTDSGSVRVSGRFRVDRPLDLGRSNLTLSELLDEIGGAGELVRGRGGAPLVPITLTPRTGSKPSAAIYETASGARPSVRVEVKTRDARTGLMEFSIVADRATIPNRTSSCAASGSSTAELTTAFSLWGSVGAPVSVHASVDWRCSGSTLRTP